MLLAATFTTFFFSGCVSVIGFLEVKDGHSFYGLLFCSIIVLVAAILHLVALFTEYNKIPIVLDVIGIIFLFYLVIQNILHIIDEHNSLKYYEEKDMNLASAVSAMLAIGGHFTTINSVLKHIKEMNEFENRRTEQNNENVDNSHISGDELTVERQRDSDFVAMNNWLPGNPLENATAPPQPTYFAYFNHSQNIDSTDPTPPTYFPDIQRSQNAKSISPPPSYLEATQ